ncbi:4-amino-4-deoxy-L-arabinose transferase [Spirosomataceae bacterium TFI 002]|nr:4-amino-4-deoxy-L-arabinose transferase [Spirosomataceae bacterium TFI 002]
MNQMIKTFLKAYAYTLCFLAIFCIYFFNLFIDIMEVDAAQYASIAREMVESGSYLEVFHRGEDYLDKPPLLFWLSAFSFKLFGFHNWAFKLPAVLFLIGGVFCTYKFARLFYSEKVAKNAALILASCQAMMLMTNDVRTDGVLTATVIFTIWQMAAYLKTNSIKYIFGAGLGLALALMAKGPIAAIIVAAAIGGHLLLKKDWLKIIDPKWLLLLVVSLILLVPMCYGLYTQFDLHPEKYVYGLDGPSGLKFFFWTQSFGRITGDIYWSNNTGPFYFLNTILWDFQPWVLVFFLAFAGLIFRMLRGNKTPEYITLVGFVIPFMALSSSNYKLPHYIFVLLPFAAVITSNWLATLKLKGLKAFTIVQFSVMHLYFILGGLSLFYFFPETNFFIVSGFVLCFLLFWWTFLNSKSNRLLFTTVVAAVGLGLVMSTSFYPHLVQYQSRSVIGKKVNEMKIPQDQFYSFGEISFALDYYAKRTVPLADSSSFDSMKKGTYVYTDEAGKDFITNNSRANFEVDGVYDDFRVTQLHINFLKPERRKEKTRTTYLLRKE